MQKNFDAGPLPHAAADAHGLRRHRPLRRPDGRPAGGREREPRPHARPRGKRSAAQTPGETTEATPALPAVSPEELGNAPSNLSAGGAMVRGEDGALYLAQEDGIYADFVGGKKVTAGWKL